MTVARVVHESVFGDARTIAHAIADGPPATMQADVVAANEAPPEIGPDVTMLVVGGPHHALRHATAVHPRSCGEAVRSCRGGPRHPWQRLPRPGQEEPRGADREELLATAGATGIAVREALTPCRPCTVDEIRLI